MRKARRSLEVGALVALAACGGESRPPAADTSAAAAPPPAAAGQVVEVRMTGDGVTTAMFEPDTLTISAGTTLRFVNVSGGPHNVGFWTDSIPTGAAPVLQAAMAETIGDLQGKLLVSPNETYDVSFAGAPPGEYKGFCTPHLPLKMRIWVTVQ